MAMYVSTLDEVVIYKHPGASLDYLIDWTPWLGTDTIVTSAWDVPAGLTNAGESHTATDATLWIAEGVDGVTYKVVNSITTSIGREEKKALIIKIRASGGA